MFVAIKTATNKQGDFVLSIFALLVVGGLCLKGAQSLCIEIPQQSMCFIKQIADDHLIKCNSK